MKIGMYLFPRMLTSKSSPVVVTLSPGRIQVADTERMVADLAAPTVRLKRSRSSGALTLTSPQGKLILAAIGSNSAAPFTQAQEAEIEAAQALAAQDPAARQFELAQITWIGRATRADGSYQGSWRSLFEGDAKAQLTIGRVVADAMVATGAQST